MTHIVRQIIEKDLMKTLMKINLEKKKFFVKSVVRSNYGSHVTR